LDICHIAVQPSGLAPPRKPKSRIVKLEQAGLETFAEITAELNVFKAVYGVVEETGKGDDTDSKTGRFHGAVTACY
jgi:hypothetical protein